MRGISLTASLAVLVLVSSVGCKTMPSLTWWKTANKSDANATAVAHTAPALPSDVAIQTEGVAANSAAPTSTSVSASTMTTNTAAPYAATAAPYAAMATPAASPTGYPNTGAPSYVSTHSENDSNLGTIDVPYNPNAVPPAVTVASTPAPPAPSTNRYDTPLTTSYPATNMLSNSPTQISDSGSRYATQSESAANSAYSMSPTASYTPPANQASVSQTGNFGAPPASATNPVGDRYSQAAMATSAPAAQTGETASSAGTAQNQTVATSEPYRPGGTSSYPGAFAEPANYEMATRPQDATSATEGSVPNVATPTSTQAPPTTAPQVPRYW